MKQQLIEWLINEVGPEIKKSGDAHGELLKFARTKNLSPALTEALGQLYNTAKTLSFMDKNANRGGSFPLVDVPKLVEDYMKLPESESKSAARRDVVAELDAWIAPSKPSSPNIFPNLFVEVETGIKIASEIVAPHQPSSLRADVQRMFNLKHNKAQLEQQRFDVIEDNRAIFHKWAKVLRQNPSLSFEQLEADAWMACGDEAKPMLDCMAHYMDQTKRASSAGPERLVDDRNGFVGDVERLIENFKKVATLDAALVGVNAGIKEAAAAAAKDTKVQKRDQKYSPKWTDRGPDSASGKPGKGLGGKLSEPKPAGPGGTEVEPDPFLMPFKRPFFSDPGKSPFKTYPDALMSPLKPLRNFMLEQGKGMLTERENVEQKTVDTTMADTQSAAMLQNLLLTDDVLSEADPERVVAMYQTIRDTSPELANDINVMRVALRSAIQHEGMDPFAVKGFAETENERQKVQESGRKQDAAKYKIKGPSPKAEKDPEKKDKP